MWISVRMQPNSQGPICSSLDMFVRINERSLTSLRGPQPAADPEDCALPVPGDLSGLPAPAAAGTQREGSGFSALGLPINQHHFPHSYEGILSCTF